MSDQDLVAFARQRIEAGSKSFSGAAKLFDAKHREHAFMLYAWCRHCDDTVDDQILGFADPNANPNPVSPEDRLAELTGKTRAAMRGKADEPVYRALETVARECEVPERFPLDHLAGFAMDVSGHSYETFDDTLRYCYHVAGVVGIMMAMVMGVRDRPTLERACDLGMAFQLTNIARDVADDAAIGRVYLPADWLAGAGVDATDIMAPDHRNGLVEVVARMLDEADRYYASAGAGIAKLPFRCAMAIAAARSVYRAIGVKVRSRGPGAWDGRTIVSRTAKLSYLASSPLRVGGIKMLSLVEHPSSRTGLWTPGSLAEAGG